MNTLIANSGNYRIGRTDSIKYIVIHYTSNLGDTANNNAVYFHNNSISTSAHFFVDENEVWQSVNPINTAWHCGGGLQGSSGHSFYKICTNSNSIGIEMCLNDRNGNIRYGTIDKCIELTKQLMREYNIPIDKVIRHWDVVGKDCPEPMIGNNNKLWNDFKSRLKEDEEMTSEERAKFNELVKRVATLQEQVDKINQPMIYNYIDKNMPEWAKDSVKWCVDNGIIKGTGNGLGLDDKDLKYCTIIARLGKELKK